MSAALPKSHLDLIAGPYAVILSTVMADGRPQSTVVWCNTDGVHVLLNTMRGYQKEKNMQRNPRVTIFVYDPGNPLRNIEVRGQVVEMTEAGAVEHNDELTMLYLGKPHFFGDAVPAEFQTRLTPVICKVLPTRVRIDDGQAGTPAADADGGEGDLPRKGERSDPAPPAIPQSHRDLINRPIHAVLTTMMPDGQPQCSLVWWAYDGEDVLLSTTLERQKGRNMTANPKVALLVIDPANTARYVEVRGDVVELCATGAVEFADLLTRRYTGKACFYGDIYPVEQQFQETRVICRIKPRKINVDAIFQ